MKINNATFKIGDWIVHVNYGVGQIQALDTKTLSGIELEYFNVKTTQSEYWLPVNNADVDHVRPVSSKYLIRKAVKILQEKPHSLPEDAKLRTNYLDEKALDCKLGNVANLIRDLKGLQTLKKLNMREEKLLSKLETQFVQEWVAATKLSQEEAKEKLDQAIDDGLKKLPTPEK